MHSNYHDWGYCNATGPTLASCAVDAAHTSLTIEFNTTLLAGDKVVLNPYNSSLNNEVAGLPQLPASASLTPIWPVYPPLNVHGTKSSIYRSKHPCMWQ